MKLDPDSGKSANVYPPEQTAGLESVAVLLGHFYPDRNSEYVTGFQATIVRKRRSKRTTFKYYLYRMKTNIK
jgi:hypothetical protein